MEEKIIIKLTYFKKEVGLIIVPAHTVRCYIYRITNITITFDLHTEEKNRPSIHYQEDTGIGFEAAPPPPYFYL